MQPSDFTVRRFFGAFYRWTQLTRASRRSPLHHSEARHLHHHARQKEQSEYFAAFDQLYRSAQEPHHARVGQTNARRTSRPTSSRITSTAKTSTAKRVSSASRRRPLPTQRLGRRRKSVSALLERHGSSLSLSEVDLLHPSVRRGRLNHEILDSLQVLSEDERSFHEIAPLTCVLRSRSPSHLELDCVVPLDWKAGLGQLLSNSDRPDAPLKADFSEASRTIAIAENEPLAGTVVQSVRLSGCSASILSALEILCRLRYPILEPIRDSRNLPSRRLDLSPWVVRSRANGQLALESLITETAWSHASDEARASLRSVAGESGVDLHIHDARPCVGGVGIPFRRSCHPIVLSGPPGAVTWALWQIKELKAEMELKASQAQSEAQEATAQKPRADQVDPTRKGQDISIGQASAHLPKENPSQLVQSGTEVRDRTESETPIAGSEEPVLDGARLSEDMRVALRLLTQPVVLVTTSSNSKSGKLFQNCRGVTVSSFTTVTLQPTPIVSFNLKLPSRSWNIMNQTRHDIRIHILDAAPQGAAIADTFTRPYDRAEEPFHRLVDQGVSVELPGPPLIGRTGGVLAHIHAHVGKSMMVGDHMLVTAKVSRCDILYDKQQKNVAGLSYAAQGYRERGGNIPVAFSPADSISQQMSSAGEHVTQHDAKKEAESAHNSYTVPRAVPLISLAPQHRALAMASASSGQVRRYSTTPTPRQVFKNKPGHDDTGLVEPTARKTTVADFFNVPDDDGVAWRFPHVKSLIRADRTAKAAARRLKAASEPGVSLTHAEVQELENTLRVNERIVDKKLSKSAARSLRLMLDKGRVDFKRAQWLESSIERGQAVLAEDMKQIDDMFRQGQMDESTFRVARQKLEADHDALVTESMRLRQIVDEEGDSPALDPGEEVERRR